ncbi:sugar transferase [Desulfosediminicola ganghwensis]|uniref:sugar transferase n=1 Tax=Desulfosediminicola ganghwensis TaxID=2569540 RepID=UPI0010ABC2B0|nr:sugar transferase [Desulfosediminicola ganghwensis]
MYEKFLKRFVDFVLALTALLVLLPFLLPICVLLLLTGEHEVFYLQKRVGCKNKDFKVWKFATMLKDSPNIGAGSITLRDDPRVFPVGKFLRKTKINELPQVINVLIGNMSIVGPRPLMEVDFAKFSDDVQAVVYNTNPGITGIGSIIFRDEEKWMSDVDGDPHDFDKKYIAPYKGALELWYQENISIWTDVKIIFCTAWVILFSESYLPYRIFDGLPEKPDALG